MAKRVAIHVFLLVFRVKLRFKWFFLNLLELFFFVRQQTLARIGYLRASGMMVRKNGSFCVKFRA